MLKLVPPAAVIFDMDGLIFDTEVLYAEALLAEAAVAGLPDADARALAVATCGCNWQTTHDLLRTALPPTTEIEPFVSAWMKRYRALAADRLVTKPGVRELLDALDAADIPRAVATGTRRAMATAHLVCHGLLDRFDTVITADECREGKPHPEPFQNAAAALGVPPSECWALEDSPNGVRSAHGAKMAVIMVPDTIQPDASLARLCAAVVPDLHAVCELLAQAR